MNCDHWLGEEPYDAERAAMIAAAVSELQCDSLVAAEAALVERYAGDEAVMALMARVTGQLTDQGE